MAKYQCEVKISIPIELRAVDEPAALKELAELMAAFRVSEEGRYAAGTWADELEKFQLRLARRTPLPCPLCGESPATGPHLCPVALKTGWQKT